MKLIFDFLTDLKANNNREWFAENKEKFLAAKAKFEALSETLIAEIAKFDPDIQHVQSKDCLFRIYRDTRFSYDKTPYKTHFGVYIAAAGGRKSERGGYYLHLDPDGCFLGAGVWCPQPEVLKALRQSVFDNIEEFNEILNAAEFKQHHFTFFQDDKLKTVPRGFPKDFPQADLLKLKHYILDYQLDKSIFDTPDFIAKIVDVFRAALPFNKFLNFTVDEILNK